MSGPSDKAVEAAIRATLTDEQIENVGEENLRMVAGKVPKCLDAAHDPALGLDRSVCLRDVVEKVRMGEEMAACMNPTPVATFLRREFGGEE